MVKAYEQFYEAEIRDDYPVSEKIKKVWAVEIDLLSKMLEICDKHKIKCFAIGGTLLGAVRHRGFIPWDDDIDIGMLRSDYDKFIKVAQNELKEPYFLQTAVTDRCYRPHAQIRNSDTTGYQKLDRNLKCNKGIFIDIFPLDGIPDNKLEYKLQMSVMKLMNRIMTNDVYFTTVHEKASLPALAAHLAVKLLLTAIGRKRFYGWYDACAAICKNKSTKRVGELTVLFDDTRYQWRRSYFRNIKMMAFEYIQIPVPADYDYFLKNTFGEYMKYPEDKNSGALHGDMVFEPDTPYRVYEQTNKHCD